MSKRFVLYVFLILPAFLSSQQKPEIIWPLDSPRVITGNFGELRPNHFHTGLDFSTNGNVNLQVYAIEEGYVSRIRVSAGGYGKVLYITHSNGTTSVYAHLNAFSLKISRYLTEEQVSRQNYEVDFYLRPYSVFINKNEIIGLSGNTGNSTGPHLHFEIRDEKSEMPLNPLNSYHIHDQTPPVLEHLAFYNLEDTLSPILIKTFHPNSHALYKDTLAIEGSILGLAFSAYDQFLRDGNHNNVYSAMVFIDRELIYSHALREMNFTDNRYVNEFSDYHNGYKFQKCFLPEVYPMYLYSAVKNKGRIELRDNKSHLIELVLTDESGNTTACRFFIRSVLLSNYKSFPASGDCFVNCRRDTSIQVNGIRLIIPEQSFFRSQVFYIKNQLEESRHLFFQPSQANLRLPIQIMFQAPSMFNQNKEKLILKSREGTVIPQVRNDSLLYSIKNLGDYELLMDTKAPTVKTSLSLKRINRLDSEALLHFHLEDDLSGLGKYSLFLNTIWVPAEYDIKTQTLWYRFGEESPKGELEIKLEISDRVGNASVITYQARY